jgi:hypothetical protein
MKLIFHTLNDGVQEFEIEQTSVLIGRGSNCDVILKVEGLSRQHCKIEIDRKGNFFVTDLGSTNGVMIDGQLIPPNTPTAYSEILPLAIGSIPNVTLEASEPEAVEVTFEAPKKAAKVVLELPKSDKKWTKKGGVPVPKMKVERIIPWRMVIGVLVLVALTALFFQDLEIL